MSLTKVSYSMINGASVNVLDYGADSTGTNSASTALQSAIDSFSGSAGVVYFPNGSYKLTANVTLPSNITLLSYGAIIVCNGFGFVVGASKSNIVVNGLSFNQAYSTGTPNTIAIPSTASKITIQNCLFYGGGFYVLVLGGRSIRVINNKFTDTPTSAHVATASAYDVLISGNQFYNIGLSYVLLLRNSIGINVSNNTFDTISNNPILVDSGAQNVTVTGNVLTGTGDSGILCANDASGTVPSFVNISNNVVTGSPDTGIGVLYGQNITITGNVLQNNGSSGTNGYNSQIYLGGNQQQVSVIGNTLINTSYNPSAILGIYAIYSDTGATTTQTTEMVISGNNYSGFAAGNNISIPVNSGGTVYQPAKIQILEGAARSYPSNANLNFEAWASTYPDNISGLTTFSFAGTGATCTKETSTVVYGNSAKIVGGSAAGVLTATLTALNFFQTPCVIEVTAWVKPSTSSDTGYVALDASIAGGSPAPAQKIAFGGSSTAWTPVTVRMVVGTATNVNIQFVANAGSTIYFDETTVNIQMYNN
jgi:Pectate lyase superfamily protein/Periplasmic copper-binding protein (NosD)